MSKPHEDDKVGLFLVAMMPIVIVVICAVSVYLSGMITL